MAVPLRVVIVEDEPIILKHIAQKVCELDGNYEIFTADNGFDALDLINAHNPHILLTDIEMSGMSGLELVQKAKEALPGLLTVIISGYDRFNYAQTALRYGVNDYLLKPVDIESLQMVFEALDKMISAEAAQLEDIQGTDNSEPKNLAEKIEQYLVQNYDKNISMSDLTSLFNYADSYISRMFKKNYGCSPIHYHIRLKITKSMEFLKENPEKDIKEAAATVGYSDARYFSRIFKQFEGVSPTEWLADKQSESSDV